MGRHLSSQLPFARNLSGVAIIHSAVLRQEGVPLQLLLNFWSKHG